MKCFFYHKYKSITTLKFKWNVQFWNCFYSHKYFSITLIIYIIFYHINIFQLLLQSIYIYIYIKASVRILKFKNFACFWQRWIQGYDSFAREFPGDNTSLFKETCKYGPIGHGKKRIVFAVGEIFEFCWLILVLLIFFLFQDSIYNYKYHAIDFVSTRSRNENFDNADETRNLC